MKRKDLEALGLEKEVVDKIMDMNGSDIEAEKSKTRASEQERDKYKDLHDTATAELELNNTPFLVYHSTHFRTSLFQ